MGKKWRHKPRQISLPPKEVFVRCFEVEAVALLDNNYCRSYRQHFIRPDWSQAVTAAVNYAKLNLCRPGRKPHKLTVWEWKICSPAADGSIGTKKLFQPIFTWEPIPGQGHRANWGSLDDNIGMKAVRALREMHGQMVPMRVKIFDIGRDLYKGAKRVRSRNR